MVGSLLSVVCEELEPVSGFRWQVVLRTVWFAVYEVLEQASVSRLPLGPPGARSFSDAVSNRYYVLPLGRYPGRPYLTRTVVVRLANVLVSVGE